MGIEPNTYGMQYRMDELRELYKIEAEAKRLKNEVEQLNSEANDVSVSIESAKKELAEIQIKTITAYRELFNVINLKGEYGLPLEGGAE